MLRLSVKLLWGVICLLPISAVANVTIFACEPEWTYIANQIGGENVTTFSATTPKQNAHYISAKPSLVAKMRKADMVFCSGSGLEEGWLPVLLKSAGTAQVQPGNAGYFMASDYVEKLGVIHDASLIDRSMGDIHPEGNPHVHLDPRRYVEVAKAFTNVLSQLDNTHAVTYQHNLDIFTGAWQTHIAKWENQAQELRGRKIITYHKNFTYLADWLGLDVVDTIEAKPGIIPNSKHLSQLVAAHKNADVHKILTVEYEDEKPAQWLSSKIDTDAATLAYTSGDNMPELFDAIIEQLK